MAAEAYVLKAQFPLATGDLYYAAASDGGSLVLDRDKATRYPSVSAAHKARLDRIARWKEAGKVPAPLVIVPAKPVRMKA